MPYDVHLEKLPAGIAAEHFEAGDVANIIVSSFISDENGMFFYKFLDNFSSQFLGPFTQSGRSLSQIDHCLVLINKNKHAKVYVNELQIGLNLIIKREAKAGEGINKLDVAGLIEVFFNQITLPQDNGIIFYFSVGWKRGLFFDFRPLHEPDAALGEIGNKLARYFEYLLFQEIYTVEPSVWDELYKLGWFPFISILDGNFENLLLRVADKQPIDSTEQMIINSFDGDKISQLLEKFRKKQFLNHHIDIIAVGIERYQEGDYVSSINNIWPRVEGILTLTYTKHNKNSNQYKLLENMSQAVANELISPTIFLPYQFKEYLQRYYFKNYSLRKQQFDLSRHSIGHGTSKSGEYSQKRALLGILMIDQLSYYLSLEKTQISN